MTFQSSSGRAKLWVNPSSPEGKGPAFYKVVIDGKVVWQKNLPFTFFQAGISDDGLVGGYSYTEGKFFLGEFVVALLDRQGAVVLEDRTKRVNSRFLHTDPDPKVDEFIFDPANDRMIIGIDGADLNTGTQTWWTYQLSSRKRTANLYPEGKSKTLGHYLHQTKPIPGSKLLITNWYSFSNDQMGQFFTLVDETSKPVWRLDLPGDYEMAGNVKPERKFDLRYEAMGKGTILGTPAQNRFEIRHVKKAQRVTYEISHENGALKVKEVSRKPYVAEANKPVKASAPKLKVVDLKQIGKVMLPVAKEMSAEVRDIGDFHFMGKDRIVFLRAREEICVADLSGRLVRRIPLPKQALSGNPYLYLAQCKGSRFILAASISGEPDRVYAWNLDAANGVISQLKAFESFRIDALAAFPDGRFAVISTEDVPFSQINHLSFHAADGKRLWIKGEQGFGGDPDELLSPEAVHIDSKGRIVVLDNITHTLQFFRTDGSFESAIDLDNKWKGDHHYPTEVTCQPNGRFWVYDFNAEKPCYELDPSGNVLRHFIPTYTSGKGFASSGKIRLDGEGRPWVTNDSSFFRLDASGKVAQTIGNSPRGSGLGVIEALHVGFDGKIFALDGKTCGVHVFTSAGKKLFVGQPKATEFEEGVVGPWFDVTPSGDIFLYGSKKAEAIRFAPDGKRLPDLPERKDWREVGPERLFQRKPTWRWWGSTLVDENDKAIATITRWPDLTWLTGGVHMAPNGQLMAFEQKGYLSNDKPGPYKLAFYAANGKPEAQVMMPAGLPEINEAAFDGKTCYFVTKDGLMAVDRAGKALWIYKPKGWDQGWKVFPSQGGLALYDGARTITWVKPTG